MNWLDRYIESVKRYLPERSRDDIGDELRSVLEEKMDDAKEASGGTLEAADELRILKEFGHPLKVASSYQEQQVLISEPLFPIYKTVIKYLLLILGTVYIASIVVEAAGWVEDVNIGLETIGLWYFAIITLSFYSVSIPAYSGRKYLLILFAPQLVLLDTQAALVGIHGANANAAWSDRRMQE